MNREALKLCDAIVRLYMATPDPSERLQNLFVEWLTDGRHCCEKEIVLRRLFYAMLDNAATRRVEKTERMEQLNQIKGI